MATNDIRIFPKNFITILSMDGGGVRGLISAIVLRAVEKEVQELKGDKNARIAEYFDIIAGTSAGGISTSILTCPDGISRRPKYTTDDLVHFHLTQWSRIFPQVRDKAIKELLWVSHLAGPMYQNANFCEVMKEMFQDAYLSRTTRSVVIPSFNIQTMQPHIFSSYEARRDKKLDAPLKHVALATSSAPLYLPPYFFESTSDAAKETTTEYNVIDGYVVANNPTWLAVTEGLKEFNEEHGKSTGTIRRLLILSLGTGSPKVVSKYNAQNTRNWGTVQWLYSLEDRCRPFNDVFQAAASNLVDIQLRAFLDAVGCSDGYLRIQKFDLEPELVPVDDSSEENIQKLKKVAEELVTEKQAAIKEFAQKLVAANRCVYRDENSA